MEWMSRLNLVSCSLNWYLGSYYVVQWVGQDTTFKIVLNIDVCKYTVKHQWLVVNSDERCGVLLSC